MVLRIVFVLFLFIANQSLAASSATGLGISAGSGIPFLGQAGVNYKVSDKLSFYVGYNILSLDVDAAKAELTMPEASVFYHPFSGSFFIGLGVGQESLEVSATDTTTNQEVKAEVDALTGMAKLGWMWGVSNGGFWFGVDLAYIQPFNSDVTITAPGVPTTDPDYQDVVDAADRFGDTGYINFTFARLGYIF